jgi:CHAT domain-containing protein
LLKYKPQLKNLLTQKPFDLAAIQPNIPNDSAILQYVPTDEGLIIFVVDNKNLKTRINKAISKDILNKEIQAYRQLFEKEIEKIKLTGRVTPITSWKYDKSNAYKKEILPLKQKSVFLYDALITPIEKDIANKKVIAIIANGWLRYLPFQSLGKPTDDGELKFLILDKSIVYLDSVIAISKNTTTKLKTSPSIAVFANPDGTLAGANKEAEVITMLFNKTTTGIVQKPFNISLLNQLANKAEILHLATHGYLDGTNIDSSFLVSGKKIVKGVSTIQKLFLKDIYDLNLNNNKLVVLSGCDTGKLGSLSNENEPDDIVGSLASAFRVAGANTILASLWKAHDEATKLLMQSFYENIKLGLNKAEALRQAELKVKSNPQFGHPLFWSLFNLIGDWR